MLWKLYVAGVLMYAGYYCAEKDVIPKLAPLPAPQCSGARPSWR